MDYKFSNLNKTWILDLDGTILLHNGHINEPYIDTILPGVKEFFENKVKVGDFVLITTARTEEYRQKTIDFLNKNKIRYDDIIFGLPHGERILINDRKNSGLKTSYGINVKRNEGFENIKITIDEDL